LAGGLALNSFGMVSRSLSGGLQQGRAVYRKAVKLAAAPGGARSRGVEALGRATRAPD
jgi:hypothetical protein